MTSGSLFESVRLIRPKQESQPMRSHHSSCSRVRSSLVISGAMALTGGLVAGVPSEPPQVAAAAVSVPDDLAAWRAGIWEAALDGDDTAVSAFLADLPRGADPGSVTDLRDALAARETHAAATDEDRAEGRQSAAKKIEDALGANDLTDALTAAVELQTLSDDWNGVLDEPGIVELIRVCEIAEAKARAESDWLFVQEILFRLRTLHEDTDRKAEHAEYERRLDEVNRRIGLLARYAPRALHELRGRQVARIEPETEFPPFNEAFAEDWKVPLQGITERMVRSAMLIGATQHISACGWEPLLDGGLEALEIFASTDQLSENFPGLADRAKVDAWLDRLRAKRTRLGEADPAAVGRQDYHAIMPELLVANPETIDVPEAVVLREFAEGATYRLEDVYEDQYTQMIWPEQLRRFEQQVQGDFVGVGILIRHDDKRELMVQNPLEGSPASRAGVEEEDHIVSVDGVPTTGWSLTRAVDEITGPQGEEVVLTVRREGEEQPIDIPIVRDRIKIRSVNGWFKESLADDGTPKWNWFADEDAGIGYVRLTSFNDDSFDDFLTAVSEMRKERPLNGLVLDLRFNPGGLLESAIRFSNLFVPEGRIVSCEDRDGVTVWSRPAQKQMAFLEGLPLVVLVNPGSASASEIVSGCLQAHRAAVVVGERSFGKGSVQTVHDVSDRQGGPAAFKITNQYYALPPAPGEMRGRLVHKMPGADDWGVNPDLAIEMTPEQTQAAYELRRKADLIADWDEDRDPADRPNPEALIIDGIDPQLETAILLLKARLLPKALDARMAEAG
jgi:carboxyl-terminal processing protease